MKKVRVQMSIRRPDILNVARFGSDTPGNVGQQHTLSLECFLPFPLHFSFNVLFINVFVII